MTMQTGNEGGSRKVLKTIYQNQFQVVGYKPWYSPFQYATMDEAKAELNKLHFTDAMTVQTTVRRVVLRVPRERC